MSRPIVVLDSDQPYVQSLVDALYRADMPAEGAWLDDEAREVLGRIRPDILICSARFNYLRYARCCNHDMRVISLTESGDPPGYRHCWTVDGSFRYDSPLPEIVSCCRSLVCEEVSLV